MGIHIGGFFTCDCGKLHARAHVWVTSTCTCGRQLWPMAWGRKA